ncbi:hypothetical protein BJ508DRAFT_324173 [Ascobolus immersus RN42]|uniref:Uncharacterized protein n=1 Tax=Ascobolus immersus RN42 TaxID=1160509 RepID=A0A3N4IED6_ASCIM|nr:hypothetical protein BJ508DRAFT_324173 [Ascobolus immersus RN42]
MEASEASSLRGVHNLHIDVSILIFKELDSFSTVCSLALTSPHFYSAFSVCKKQINKAITLNRYGEEALLLLEFQRPGKTGFSMRQRENIKTYCPSQIAKIDEQLSPTAGYVGRSERKRLEKNHQQMQFWALSTLQRMDSHNYAIFRIPPWVQEEVHTKRGIHACSWSNGSRSPDPHRHPAFDCMISTLYCSIVYLLSFDEWKGVDGYTHVGIDYSILIPENKQPSGKYTLSLEAQIHLYAYYRSLGHAKETFHRFASTSDSMRKKFESQLATSIIVRLTLNLDHILRKLKCSETAATGYEMLTERSACDYTDALLFETAYMEENLS